MSDSQEKEVKDINKIDKAPAYMREDYPYKTVGEVITDFNIIIENQIYEIKCSSCNLCIRTQGKNIKNTYEKMANSGCVSCGNKKLVVKMVNIKDEE